MIHSRIYFILFLWTLIGIISCSEDAPNCEEGFPKTFSNQSIISYQIDVYHFDAGNLTYVRTMNIPNQVDDRTITLIDQNVLSDSWVQPGNVDYVLEDGCIKDYRDWQQIKINEDCTLITINILTVLINGGGYGPKYLCEDSEIDVINKGVDFFLEREFFDSVYIEKYQVELSLEVD